MSATPSSRRRQRLTERELRAAVAHALLHLWDIPCLADSPLTALPVVQRRSQANPRLLFAEGHALAAYLHETVADVIVQLEGEGKIAILRDLLQGVCTGKSIAQVAREHGRSREHFSRHHWYRATSLVARQISTLNAGAPITYHDSRVR
jgi:hypothetical protein